MKSDYVSTGRTNQKLETRKKILESAQHFLNNGLDFNLEDIATKSGVSRATIYRYYSNSDILAAEAGLDVKTKSPESLSDSLKGISTAEKVLEIQEYYNSFTVDHEKLFRKYLSSILDPSNTTPKRGARRKRTLDLVLQDTNFSEQEKEDLSNLFTIFMGIEPFIVTKDVCGLDNEKSIELLRWGAKLMYEGFIASKQIK